MNWTPPFIAMPEPYVDVDVVLYRDGDGYYRDIAFVDDQGRWQLSQGRVIFVVPLLWNPAPEIPVDVQRYIEQCQALARGEPVVVHKQALGERDVHLLSTMPTSRGVILADDGDGCMHDTFVSMALSLAVKPTPESGAMHASTESAWWCFSTSQLHVALESWIGRIRNTTTSTLARSAVEGFLKSEDAAKLRGADR